VADLVLGGFSVRGLHLADTTAGAVRTAGLTTVGLLATGFTMEQAFYRDRLAGHGLRVLVPDAADRAEVHRVIYEELCLGLVRDDSRELYRQVIERLVAAGAEGIILGCTEIELLIGAADSPVPVFPTTRLHVEAAVAVSLAGLPT
jgi:aspartate racemase